MQRRKKSFSYISTVVRKHHQLQEPILTPKQKQKTSTLSIKLHIFQSTNKRQPVLFKEEKFSVDLQPKLTRKKKKMKADSITSPIRKQGFRASMTVKW